MPGLCGVACAKWLRLAAPGSRVVIHTARQDPVTVFSSLAAGVRGYLAKPLRPPDVVDAVVRVLRGDYVFSRQAEELIFAGLGRMGSGHREELPVHSGAGSDRLSLARPE
jgi:DNA-binding NarL/FixJ family response regulator